MSRSLRTRVRTVAGLAAAATVGAVLPLAGTSAVHAAEPAACTAPTGLSPDDGYRSVAPDRKDIVLRWSSVTGAASYDVQVSANEDFTNNVSLNASTAGTSLEVAPLALQETSYFWRVRVSGARCWSDDGATHAASFSRAWTDVPNLLSPAARQSVPRNLVRFSWTPVREASLYEVVLGDASGRAISRCFTAQPTLTPYSTRFATDGGERLYDKPDCIAPTDIEDNTSYTWQVTPLDGTNVATLDGKPYLAGIGSGPSGAKPVDVPSGDVQITRVVPRSGGQAGGTNLVITGAGFRAPEDTSTGRSYHNHVNVAGNAVADSAVRYVSATELRVVTPPAAKPATGDVAVTVDEVGASAATPRDRFTYLGGDGGLGSFGAEVLPDVEIGRPSAVGAFTVTPAVTGSGSAPAGIAIRTTDRAGDLTVDCATECAGTPTITWSPTVGATEYRVYLWQDAAQSRLLRVFETHATSFTPREDLLDNQAGRSYYVSVQRCDDAGCYDVTGVPAAALTFRKRSPGVQLLPPSGRVDAPTLKWHDYGATTGIALQPRAYRVQVAKECDFANVLDEGYAEVGDIVGGELQPQYTSLKAVYSPGTYFYRVQAVDQTRSPLTWGSGPDRDGSSVAPSPCGTVAAFTITSTGGVTAGAPAGTQPDGTVSKTGTTGVTGAHLVDSSSTAVHRSGSWSDRSAKGSLGGKVLVAKGGRHERLSLGFTGTAVTVGYCTGPMNGGLDVYVDGKLKRNLSLWGPFTRCGKASYFVGGLRSAAHTVAVRATGVRGRGRGQQVAVDFFRYV